MWENIERLFVPPMQSQLAEFTAATGIDVEVVSFQGEAEMLEALAASSPEAWPDFVIAHETVGRALADTGRLVRPTSCEPEIADRLQPLAVAVNRVDGELASVPLWMSLPMLYFDANKVRAAGLDPDAPPLTLDDVVDWSSMLVQSGASTRGLALNDWCGELVMRHLVLAGEPVLRDEVEGPETRGTRITLSPAGVLAAAADLQMLREGAVDGHVLFLPSDKTGFSDLQAIGDPDSGAAMALHTSASLRPVLDAVSTLYTDVDVRLAPFPGGGVAGSVSLWHLSPGDSTGVGSTWALAEWLSQREQGANWSVATGLISAVTGAASEQVVMDAWEREPQLRAPYDALAALTERGRGTHPIPGPWVQLLGATANLCQSVMTGENDAEAAVRLWVDDVNNAIDVYEMSRLVTDSTRGGGDIELSVACTQGVEVAGVWIQAFGSQSGFAREADDGTFHFSVEPGDPYVAHVGCGETDGRWASVDWSPILLGRSVNLDCEGTNRSLPGTCIATAPA